MTVYNIVISAYEANVNLRTKANAAGYSGAPADTINCTINAGVNIYSASVNLPAFTTGIFPAGVILNFTNNGMLWGKGGDGGAGGSILTSYPYYSFASSGERGGIAFIAESSITVDNLVDIRAGGGGGGGGAVNPFYDIIAGGGGGGGAGLNPGTGGAAGISITGAHPIAGYNGTNMLPDGHGVGGNGGDYQWKGGKGGDGGNYGEIGSQGESRTVSTLQGLKTYNGGQGGAAGQAIIGMGNIIWLNHGTIIGSVDGGFEETKFLPLNRYRKYVKQISMPYSKQFFSGKIKKTNSRPFNISFDLYQVYSQHFRIADDGLNFYELYIGKNTYPDFTAPQAATSATLPFSYALTPPGAGYTDFYIVIRKRNSYDLASFNIYERIIRIDSNGDQVYSPLSAPTDVSVYDKQIGAVRVQAKYIPDIDTADKWEIYIADGVDPIPGTDTPVYIGTMSHSLLLRKISKILTGYTEGHILHIIVSAYRTLDGARANSAVTLHTVASSIDITDGHIFGGESVQLE